MRSPWALTQGMAIAQGFAMFAVGKKVGCRVTAEERWLTSGSGAVTVGKDRVIARRIPRP